MLKKILKIGVAIIGILILFNVISVIGKQESSANKTDDPHKPKIASDIRQQPTKMRQNWEMSSSKSEIDDTIGYTIICDAEAPVSKRNLIKGIPHFVIRYKEGRTTAHISYPFFLSNQKMPVTIRFDSDEAITDDWDISTSNDAVFMPYPIADLLQMIEDSKKMVVRLTPFGESPVTSTFKISGFRSIVSDNVIALLKSGDHVSQ